MHILSDPPITCDGMTDTAGTNTTRRTELPRTSLAASWILQLLQLNQGGALYVDANGGKGGWATDREK